MRPGRDHSKKGSVEAVGSVTWLQSHLNLYLTAEDVAFGAEVLAEAFLALSGDVCAGDGVQIIAHHLGEMRLIEVNVEADESGCVQNTEPHRCTRHGGLAGPLVELLVKVAGVLPTAQGGRADFSSLVIEVACCGGILGTWKDRQREEASVE